MFLSLVVPCYNEEGNVEKFFSETNRVFDGKGFEYEFVFVNDGSRDKTGVCLKKLYEENKENCIQVLSFSRNFGKEAAIYAGLQAANGDMVCIIDADLQQRPEVVLRMLDTINNNEELDCVAAYQEKRKESKLMISLKNAFYRIINKVTEVDFVSGASDFRLMKRNMVDAVLEMTEYHRFSKGILSWVGFNTEYIPYNAEERESGESKWSTRKLFKYAFEGIISFSTFPLKLAAYVGFISSVLSVLYLIFVIIKKLAFGIDVRVMQRLLFLSCFLVDCSFSALVYLENIFQKFMFRLKTDRFIF